MQSHQKKFTKFRVAFNQNYAKEVQKKVGKIRKVLLSLRRAAEQATQDRVKITQQELCGVKDNVQYLKAAVAQDREDRNSANKKMQDLLAAADQG